jgi:hypothetical protein
MKIKSLMLSLLVAASVINSASAAQVAYAQEESAKSGVLECLKAICCGSVSNNRGPGNCPPCKIGLLLASALISRAVVPTAQINEYFRVNKELPKDAAQNINIEILQKQHSDNMNKTKANLAILALRVAALAAAYRILNNVAWYKLLKNC